MNNQRGGVLLTTIIILAVIYGLLLLFAFRGWGYPGYFRGYSYGPSFWYWGGPHYYSGPSVRTGSAGGPAHLGGGPGSGK